MEIWDAYTRDGEKTGHTLIRGRAIPQGLYHMVCGVLVRHADGSYLLMQRDLRKASFPGWYEATAGGAALAGEDKHACIRRELMEETGLTCDTFEEIGRFVHDGHQRIFHVFACTVDCDKAAVKLQAGETISFKWLSEAEFIEFVNSDQMIPTQKTRFHDYFMRMGYIR